MQQLNKRIIFSLAAMLIACGVSLSSVAYARDGSDDSNSGSGSSSNETENETENEQEVEDHAHDLMEQFKKKGRGELETEFHKSKNMHNQQGRQKSCEARKNSLSNRMENMTKYAQNHKSVFDKIYTRVKTFHDDKNLNTPNYDQLLAEVDAAQTAAAENITALGELNVDIDCTQGNVAEGVSAFRTAIKSTRDSLKDYRKALVKLITSLHDSAGDNSSSDDSSSEGTE